MSDNTPLPPEIPHALNPPDGAIVDDCLGERPKGEITLEVVERGPDAGPSSRSG